MILFTTILLFCVYSQTVFAQPSKENVVSNFMNTLITKGKEEAMEYVSSDVKIPEIRENTRISGVSGLPSPKENVRVSVAYFDDGENEPERIAFIWEITSRENKITDIRVVYDGSNPFMNELNILKEFRKKYDENILGLSNFPFEITHVEGEIKGQEVTVNYKSSDSNGVVHMNVVSKENELEHPKGKSTRLYYLKNGTKAFCTRDASNNYKLVYQYDGLQYTLVIDGINTHPNDLIYVANSMFLN